MSIVDVLSKNLNRIQISMTFDEALDYRLYCLFDTQEECVLDQWKISNDRDFHRMVNDLMQIYKGDSHENAPA